MSFTLLGRKKTEVITLPNGTVRFQWTKQMSRSERQPSNKNSKVDVIITDYLNSEGFKRLAWTTRCSYINKLRIIEKLILSNNMCLPAIPVSRVDYNHVDYIHNILAHIYAPGTIKILFTILSCIWELALRNGKAILNPWLRNKVIVKNERDVTWTKEELNAAFTAANELGFTALYKLLIFMYETAQRPQDLLDLTYKNVVHKADGSTWIDFIISKTGVHLEIPLSTRAIAVLEASGGPESYLFCDKDGALKYQRAYYQFKCIRHHAKINKELTFRDIRRTVVVELVEAGATDQELRGVAGWKNNNVVHRYSRIRGSYAKSALDKRNAHATA